MPRDRGAVLRQLTPPATPAPPPAPPEDIEEIVDTEQLARLNRVYELMGVGMIDTDILRTLMKEYAVPRKQAQADYADARDRIRAHHDNEGSIDGAMYGAMARLYMRVGTLHQIAMLPMTEYIMHTPGNDPDDPDKGAIYRRLTPGERASEVGARVQAATAALKHDESLVRLIGRRSPRWADKPSTVIQIGAQTQGLSDEDRAYLKSIGLEG